MDNIKTEIKNNSIKKRKYFRVILTFFLFLSLLGYFRIQQIWIQPEEITVFWEDLPGAFDGFKIVHLSDLHGSVFGRDNSDLYNLIKEQRPDIIVITGDIIHEGGDPLYPGYVFEGLTKIAPVYYVAGNHEWAAGMIPQIKDAARETGVTFLQNEAAEIEIMGAFIKIIGFEDPGGPYDMPKIPEVINKAQIDGVFSIALYHRNNKIDIFSAGDIPLVLSGHAHGGMIRPPFTDGIIGPSREFMPKYTSGLYYKNNTAFVVSRGLGDSGLNLRILNRVHMPVITLRCGTSEK